MSELLAINVNSHTERKNGLSYLSWAWAWAEVLKIDPQATWEAFEFDGFPASFAPDGSALVKVQVTIKGHAKTCWLPVMDHRNKAIKNPDAFAINTAIVRCLTKCISMHGLGLYIYAGEDLPEEEQEQKATKDKPMTAKSSAMASLDPEQQKFVAKIAAAIAGKFGAGNDWGAYEELESALEKVRAKGGDEQMCQVAIYAALDAQQRAALDVMGQEARKVAA